MSLSEVGQSLEFNNVESQGNEVLGQTPLSNKAVGEQN